MAAWSFNRAVYLFGTELEAELRAAADGAKNQQQARTRQQRVMAQWLGTEVKYKDPAAKSGAQASPSGTISSSEGAGPVSL